MFLSLPLSWKWNRKKKLAAIFKNAFSPLVYVMYMRIRDEGSDICFYKYVTVPHVTTLCLDFLIILTAGWTVKERCFLNPKHGFKFSQVPMETKVYWQVIFLKKLGCPGICAANTMADSWLHNPDNISPSSSFMTGLSSFPHCHSAT